MTNNGNSEETNLVWWYWLSSVSGLGPAYTRMLVDAFGGPKNVFEAKAEDITETIKLPAKTMDALEKSKGELPRFEAIANRQLKTATAMGARILALHDDDYPEFLKSQHKQAPPLLHIQGNLDLIRPRCVAIVGTRSPSTEAIRAVQRVSRNLCDNGNPIVAGMARGIDTAAHQGALESQGMTIGVLGSGLDHIYPPENAPLYAEARQRGLLVSQFPFGAPPSPANLRQRNKLIVALVEAVVIAESDVNGGAMIAARSALEQGRNLFAMQWDDMEAPARAGTRRLLEAQFAKPVQETATGIPFNQPLFPGSGGPVSKAWQAAFPNPRGRRGSDDPEGSEPGEAKTAPREPIRSPTPTSRPRKSRARTRS